MTGFYKFGANHLAIMQALDEVIDYLEKNHSLVIDPREIPKSCPYCKKIKSNVLAHVSEAHPECWERFYANFNVEERLDGQMRCQGCGSIVKDMQKHLIRCSKKRSGST